MGEAPAVQVMSGTAVHYGQWKFEVTVSTDDFPPGTFDGKTMLQTYVGLAWFAELVVLLEAVRTENADKEAITPRVKQLRVNLQDAGIPV